MMMIKLDALLLSANQMEKAVKENETKRQQTVICSRAAWQTMQCTPLVFFPLLFIFFHSLKIRKKHTLLCFLSLSMLFSVVDGELIQQWKGTLIVVGSRVIVIFMLNCSNIKVEQLTELVFKVLILKFKLDKFD